MAIEVIRIGELVIEKVIPDAPEGEKPEPEEMEVKVLSGEQIPEERKAPVSPQGRVPRRVAPRR